MYEGTTAGQDAGPAAPIRTPRHGIAASAAESMCFIIILTHSADLRRNTAVGTPRAIVIDRALQQADERPTSCDCSRQDDSAAKTAVGDGAIPSTLSVSRTDSSTTTTSLLVGVAA